MEASLYILVKAVLTVAACALCGRIHGAGLEFYPQWLTKRFGKYINGDILSPILFGLIASLYLPWYLALGGALGWWSGWSPDIGDRVSELRQGNWKLAVQRGTFLGACIALGTWSPLFILSGSMFAPVYYITRKGDWSLSEWLLGGIIGLALVFS